MHTAVREISFEGIPGPSHSFGGLAYGDFASMGSAGNTSKPRVAAKQCISKIRLLVRQGVPVVILPPHERPAFWFLRNLGYQGTDQQILQEVRKSTSWLLPIIYSSSGMWCANSATVVPSSDAADGRCHVVVANLAANLHRSLEPRFVFKVFRDILPERAGFRVHQGIPNDPHFWDEGAANHVRVAHDGPGLHLFVYGRQARRNCAGLQQNGEHITGRQTNEASLAVARISHLPAHRILLAQQSQAVIDRGVFHNDVICMGAGMTLIFHKLAVREWGQLCDDLQHYAAMLDLDGLNIVEISEEEISVDECVRTYLFNSQLVQLADGKLLMICPAECQKSEQAQTVLEKLHSALGSGLVTEFVDLSESLANGGGPACLRLRMAVTDQQFRALFEQSIIADAELLDRLERIVDDRYQDTLVLEQLGDPVFAQQCLSTLDEVARLLGYRAIYEFHS